MSDQSRFTWQDVSAYLDGDLPADRRAAFERWVAGEPDRQQGLARIAAAWREAGEPVRGTVDVDHLIANVLPRLVVSESKVAGQGSRRKRFVPSTLWIGVAGSLAAVCAAVIMWVFPMRSMGALSHHIYATPAGEYATVMLRDGSRVMLAPGSVLAVPETFGATTRSVFLMGEGYYRVSNGRVPFIVHSGPIAARVIGTTFNVRRYTGDNVAFITVLSGKVAVETRQAHTILASHQFARITDSTVSTQSVTDPAPYTGWTRGYLSFKDASIPVVLETLGRWYGYQFRLTDSSLVPQHISAVFNMAAQRETMATLRELLDVTMTVDGTVVTVRPRQVRPPSSSPRNAHPRIQSPSIEAGR